MMLKTLNKILRRSVTFHKRNFCIEKNEKYHLKERKLLRELCSKIRFRKKISSPKLFKFLPLNFERYFVKYQLKLILYWRKIFFIHLFSGPITVAEYMREVLTNPIHGFYMDKNVLGREGHFITSPEIRLPYSAPALG